MKLASPQFTAFVLLLLGIKASAATSYVNVFNPSPAPPYTNWSAAATRIQDAINIATNGDLVLVADGTYGGAAVTIGSQLNGVALTSAITVQSVNGPGVTTIVGRQITTPYWATGNARCAYLASGATLSGFTLTSGATGGDKYGGGVRCAGSAVVTNCIVTGNRAYYDGGGVYGGTVINCTISGNTAVRFGGGASSSLLNNCVLTGNIASRGAGVHASTLNNCTVVGNSVAGGSLYTCGGALQCLLNNCIVYYNSVYNDDEPAFFDGSTWNYCCTTPMHKGPGSFTAPPIFVDQSGGDYHLQSNSPCINAGNNTYVTSANDFDGNPRIAGGAVDVGAFEFQTPSSVLSYAWAQQYGIPTDGSADFSDPDGDGMNNYQESVAGTNPTNAASLLILYSPASSSNGVDVTWQSVNNRTYYLQSSTNPGSLSAFSALQSNIVGQAGTTVYTDTTATNGGPHFYRVGVQ